MELVFIITLNYIIFSYYFQCRCVGVLILSGVRAYHHNINFPDEKKIPTTHVSRTLHFTSLTCLHCRIFNSLKKKKLNSHKVTRYLEGNNKREWLKEQKNLTVPTLFSVQSATLYPRPPSNVCSVPFTKFQPTNQIAAVTAFLILPPFHVTSTISLSLSSRCLYLRYRTEFDTPTKWSVPFWLDWIGLDLRKRYTFCLFSHLRYIYKSDAVLLRLQECNAVFLFRSSSYSLIYDFRLMIFG
jgi:hypothetical protein